MTDKIREIMCTDLENKAQDYAIWRTINMYGAIWKDEVTKLLAEAYKQGHNDANTFICYDRLCYNRLIVDKLEEETNFDELEEETN